MTTPYHHGNLRRQLLDEAAASVAATGPDTLSLRELARRAGVSHGAPAHHFGSRRGLLTGLAAEGFESLTDALSEHRQDLLEMGVAYVRWALAHPGHYAVMWDPDLVDDSDPALATARRGAWLTLGAGSETKSGQTGTGTDTGTGTGTGTEDATSGPAPSDITSNPHESASWAAFSLVHGLASLWLSGALPVPADTDAATRAVAGRLFGG